ncbi:EAL domain-containing protein [Shewanella eurypsychrophilus]|uniref:EAL domain-containing protein n=1 Tax=Shewanella eurypsychrophilus TaxID=2593656 RepID=A0ABX6VCR5_9GAMM|nr:MULTISPECIES: EAL domain-containing protein [Shewanella]QFU24945.1 EAL domain-containing protein [Shewanella sp. YLB-09]QPG60125.1 EAL domain-containing protein [Shewanella eurypsychrophilus]
MSSVLNTLSLKQKLILFAAIPMLLLAIFGSMRMMHLLERHQEAKRNTLAIEITRDVEALIFELQRERGLSAGFVSSHGEKYQANLTTQRQQTDSQLDKVLGSKALGQFVQTLETDQIQAQTLRENLEQIKAKGYAMNSIRLGVNQQLNNEAFQFYSEYNHHLLVFISQLQLQTEDALQAKAYNDLLNILTIQEMAAKERGLMNQVLSAKYIDSNAFITIKSIEHQLNEAVTQALSTAGVKNKQLIREMLDSKSNQQVMQFRSRLKNQIYIVEQSYKISRLMGYGGLIHNFKNYLLRGDQKYLDSFNRAMSQVQFKLNGLKQIKGLTIEQQAAIQQIDETVNTYHHKIDQLQKLKLQNLSIAEQDNRVRINDEPMIESLSQLQYQAPEVNSEFWWQVASHRIDQLHQVTTSVTNHISRLSYQQKNESLFFLSIGFTAAVINLILLLMIGRNMISNLVESISLIARDMQKMAQDPSLELSVPVKGSDEIAQLSIALNSMLKERSKAYRQLNLAAAVFEYSSEGIVVTDADNHIELINPAFTQITGYSLEDVKGRNPSVLNSNQQPRHFYNGMWGSLQTDGKWEGEIWNKRKNGQVYPEYLAITVVKDDAGNIIQHIGLFLDISNRKKYEQDIWYKTNYDLLTKLPNRVLYTAKVQQHITTAKDNNQQLALLFIDLDRFKYTNDLYGHSVGNELLRQVASRLESLIGNNDFIARLSGDEFIIILPHIKYQHQVQQLAEKIITHLASPFGVNGEELMISASIGISLYPHNGASEELLTRNAETAMYQAKTDGRNSYRYYSSEMNAHMLERIQLEQRLRQAVVQQEFCLHYQPIVNVDNHEIIGVEALIRWQDPKFGLISPDKFIPIAEETGLIEPIGEWVLQQALRDLAHWHSQGFEISMAINVSGRQLINGSQHGFSCLLNAQLQKNCIHPRYLHIEITESMLMDDTEQCLLALESIRSLGVDIYIDDFGTGYSSLSYLKRFPISVIKIDKSFVDNMLERESDANLIKAIVMMGQSLGLKLVAEGIEKQEQWQMLQSLGCDFGQGYLFSRPLPSQQLELLLQEQMIPAALSI